MIFFPIFIRNTGYGINADNLDLHWKALNREYTEKYGPVTERRPGKGSFREVVRGGKTFLKCRISGFELEKK